MNAFRVLLDRFWVTREQDRELYYQLKRAQPEYRGFLQEQLGWNLFVNDAVVKLEKTPPKAAPWMGIAGFKDTLDYCFLCALLLFLSDLNDGEQFLLSTLTASIQSYLAELRSVVWTHAADRRSLVRVLQFATGEDVHLLLEYDGRSQDFERNQEQEVLYENTGLSRQFPTHFGQDILSCQTPEDFEALLREEEDSRRRRVHRIYQQLALCPAFYRAQGEEGDYDYLKNQRSALERHLREALGESGELHVHRGGAFFVLDDMDSFGEVYPGREASQRRRAIQDLMLLLCGQFRAKAGTVYPVEPDDSLRLSREDFRREVELCRSRWSAGWGKTLREKTPEELCQALFEELRDWMLLEERGEDLALLPASGKWTGRYPPSYRGGEAAGEAAETGEEKPAREATAEPAEEPVRETAEEPVREPKRKKRETAEWKGVETGSALEDAQIGFSEFLAL